VAAGAECAGAGELLHDETGADFGGGIVSDRQCGAARPEGGGGRGERAGLNGGAAAMRAGTGKRERAETGFNECAGAGKGTSEERVRLIADGGRAGAQKEGAACGAGERADGVAATG